MKTTRRSLVAAAAAASVAAGCAGSPRRASTPPETARTFVLIPGTWHGGWVWEPVARQLRQRGHQAYTVTCTGVGERQHLMSPDVGLATHIEDVANVLRFENLSDVVLVAHSFGGITLTGVADAMPERVEQLIFFDAFIPTRDRPAWVLRDADGAWPAWWQKRQERFVDGYQMAFHEEYPIEMLFDPATFPELVPFVSERLTTHPARQWTEPVSFANGGWESFPRSYVHCAGQKVRASSEAMWAPARGPGWQFVDAQLPRLGMLTHPTETSDLLIRLADQSGAAKPGA
ncbi:MAG: alpha/beta hydrolase [Pseudomonadota bacterium]